MEKTIGVKKLKPVTRVMKITTKKAIKKGGNIVFPLTVMLPEDLAEEWERMNKEKMISHEEAKKKLTN
jgi:hypothetical protein